MKRPFLWLHATVAILGLALSAVLITSRGGHPPAIVLLPFLLVIWFVVHAMLGLMQWLNAIGKRRTVGADQPSAAWPMTMLFAVVVLSLAVLRLLFVLVAMLISGVNQPVFFAYMLCLFLLSATCLVGILVRKPFARGLTASISLLASFVIAARVGAVIAYGRTLNASELLYAAALVFATSAFGVYVLRSARVRSFFEAGATAVR